MREALNVPEDDQFLTITEHDAANFRYGHGYGLARSTDVVYIQITVFNTRTVEQNKGAVPADRRTARRKAPVSARRTCW
jgi:4-oxalocrotonate tautomerase